MEHASHEVFNLAAETSTIRFLLRTPSGHQHPQINFNKPSTISIAHYRGSSHAHSGVEVCCGLHGICLLRFSQLQCFGRGGQCRPECMLLGLQLEARLRGCASLPQARMSCLLRDLMCPWAGSQNRSYSATDTLQKPSLLPEAVKHVEVLAVSLCRLRRKGVLHAELAALHNLAQAYVIQIRYSYKL